MLDQLREGRDRAETGIARALDHAERVNTNWRDEAAAFARGYINGTGIGHVFTAETLIEAANDSVPAPPDGRAWGGIIQSFARNGVIKRAGFRFSENAAHHGAPKTLWKVQKSI